MRIPSSIKIGASVYDVQFVEQVVREKEVLGQIDPERLLIRIDKTYPRLTQELTFLHEVVHGLFHELNEEELYNNERLVDQLGRLIYQVMRDNPELSFQDGDPDAAG